MAYIKNVTTNEVVKVANTKYDKKTGMLVGKYEFGTRFYNKYGRSVKLEFVEDGLPHLTLRPGWVVLKNGEAVTTTTPPPIETIEVTEFDGFPSGDNTEPESVTVIDVSAEPEPEPEPAPTYNTANLEGGLAGVFAPIFDKVAAQIEMNIRNRVDKEMRDLKAIAEEKATKLTLTLPTGVETHVDGVRIPQFENIVRDVFNHYHVYMFGPAGSGKSYTAKQIAAALNLPYYETNQLSFAHELLGYGDAAGNYVSTPFYEAFTKGGLFFFDEFDRSHRSVTTVSNTALANRRCNFPVVGMVEAHPDFRCISAGNTPMTGADLEYTAAELIDVSSRDRFAIYRIPYCKQVELPVHAGNDDQLYRFMEDVRKTTKAMGINLLASPRSTKYLKAHESDRPAALQHGLFKYALGEDDLKNLLSAMQIRNEWTDALEVLIENYDNY